MMNTKINYKDAIRSGLQSIGTKLVQDGFLCYWNDLVNNGTTYRRFKFEVDGRKRGLSETELTGLATALQAIFPEYRVETKNYFCYVVVTLKWKK